MNYLVRILFIFLFAVILGNSFFVQAQNNSSLSKPSEPSPSKTSPSNPYSVWLQKFSAAPATPSASQPQSPNTNTSPQKPNANPSHPLLTPYPSPNKSISPYDSDHDIFLNHSDLSTNPNGSRMQRARIAREKALQALEERKTKDAALTRAKSIVGLYDPEVESYEADLAKLNAIVAELSSSIVPPTKNLIAPMRLADNPRTNLANIPILPNTTVIGDNNNSIINDSSVKKWEIELAELMRSIDAENKSTEITALALRIERRKQFLNQQSEALRDADIFMIDPTVQLPQRLLEEGWCNLFDGKTLFGWRTQTTGNYGGGQFSVKNGEICSDPRHPGLIYTTNQFGDSAISFEFCTDDDTELFLLYRTSPNPRDLHTSCYTIVLNSIDPKRPRGTILGRLKFDREQLRANNQANNYDLQELNEIESERKEIWHKARISCDSGSLSCTIDRQLPITLTDVSPIGRGYVGLLVTRGAARFKNIMWRPGSAYPLFDGLEIESSWRYKLGKISPTAINASMQLQNGPGFVETFDSFSDFVLQFEYRVNNISGKSGLSFRSNPREERSGYEISLQNFPLRKDRDKFFAIDAGSFVGRQSGRYVGAGDLEWNYFTLSAIDRQFQTWINGIPACEMTDKNPIPQIITTNKQNNSTNEREISDNILPTKDEFHLAGTLQFYLENDTSNINIRRIKITKIPNRTIKKQTIDDYTKTTWKSKLKEDARIKKENKLDKEMKENNQAK
ncbi:MAG: DUF1080 domain-containing protein [Planctomycetaceae bacterium]|jgi:hypothetical protein|nr:DUF1080 domain-containing protein [Planctomycetaceae bacterium]